MKLLLPLFILISLGITKCHAQRNASISGKVASEAGAPLPEVFVYLNNTSYYTATDENGNYTLNVPPGKYNLTCTAIGYLPERRKIILAKNERLKLNFTLENNPDMALEEVSVIGRSALQEVQESSFNVVAINAEALHNTTLDVSQALERASGVRVRRTGGVGSDMNIMLNGFTGRHVKYFIDGIPMEGFNSAFALNNLPINLAKRIEVYKGVVPITFGSDALGGAINIVTEDRKQNFLDASYSYGSFNTHKSFLNTAYTSNSGFTARLTAFQNYSDNDYKVDVGIVDLETRRFTGDVREVRRFHDMYRNYTLIGKIGFVNKSFADRLLLGFTYGDEFDEIQHPALMDIAFGQIYSTAETLMPSLVYNKKDLFTEDLDVSLTANYNFGESTYIDDAYRKYNWLGEYIVTEAPGEFNYTRNFFSNRNGSVNSNLTYKILDKHAITVNNVLNTFSRKSRNEVEPSGADAYPSETIKNILGLGYKFQPDDKLSASGFFKYYYNQVNDYADSNGDGNFQNMGASTKDYGYGAAASYFLFENLQLKASYEKAYRLPTGRELFGAGNSFELGNPDLKPESSDNFNAGINYNWVLDKKNVLSFDGSFIYRDIKDFIRQVINTQRGTMVPGNDALIENRGIDFEMRYARDNFFTAGASFTYQDLRNKLKYREGRTVVSTLYDRRVPNMPYLYGNFDFSFFFNNVWERKDRLSINYNMLYVQEFDYTYYATVNSISVPTQISHDLFLNYSIKNGRYNISLECQNILDENLYDNFRLQKPGRSFAVKFRYFLDKF